MNLFHKNALAGLTRFVGANWVNCLDDNYYTGFVLKFGENAISWASWKQRSVPLFSTEEEGEFSITYLAAIGQQWSNKKLCFGDKNSTRNPVENPVFYNQLKHT